MCGWVGVGGCVSGAGIVYLCVASFLRIYMHCDAICSNHEVVVVVYMYTCLYIIRVWHLTLPCLGYYGTGKH